VIDSAVHGTNLKVSNLINMYRECLCFAIWLVSFRSSNVNWRQRDFVIASGGRLEPRALSSAAASGGR
jgi:hypothetical protein